MQIFRNGTFWSEVKANERDTCMFTVMCHQTHMHVRSHVSSESRKVRWESEGEQPQSAQINIIEYGTLLRPRLLFKADRRFPSYFKPGSNRI